MNEILQGDSLTVLKTLPDESVDCCVTSPPYWGLRDYGTAKWEGGSEGCDHKGKPQATRKNIHDRTQPQYNNQPDENVFEIYRDICGKCGAKRIDNQLGLEKTPEEYVAKMVDVFHEVKRVLKKEGTCWLNLGDSYATHASSRGMGQFGIDMRNDARNVRSRDKIPANKIGLKEKDLVGIPWRVAFALQADGWYLRQDIIWAKPNPMPESVTDRCTKSHEYIFLLAKSQKYYFDNEAIKEPAISMAYDIRPPAIIRDREYGYNSKQAQLRARGGGKKASGVGHKNLFKSGERGYEFRNKRSVWTVATKPYKEAHFATFPEDLIAPMIKAGCPKEGIVLDPFIGSGTTAKVARYLGRNYIGIELNPAYIDLCKKRLSQQVI